MCGILQRRRTGNLSGLATSRDLTPNLREAIANFFLRAKHWQIFLLLYAAPTVAEFSAVGVISATIRSWHNFGPGGFFFLGVMVLYLLCFLAWFGSMGLFFRSIVKPELRMETQFFRFALVYPVVYVPKGP